jgi:single-stranded DNA-binding protein
MNFAGLSGRLVHTPEFRFPNSDKANAQPYCTIRLAVDKRVSTAQKKTLDQQGQPTADFFTVLCSDAPARFLKSQVEAGHLPPGTPLDVTGHLEQQVWTDRSTGAPRSTVVLRAREVRFAGRQRSLNPNPGGALRPSVASPSLLSPSLLPESARPEESAPSSETVRPEEISEELSLESAVTVPLAKGVPGTTDPLDPLPARSASTVCSFGVDDLEAFNPFLHMMGDPLG